MTLLAATQASLLDAGAADQLEVSLAAPAPPPRWSSAWATTSAATPYWNFDETNPDDPGIAGSGLRALPHRQPRQLGLTSRPHARG